MKPTTYSQIISASTYTRIMSQHIYMPEADGTVASSALKHAISRGGAPTILEIGCGPGRVTALLANYGARVHAVDIDRAFLEEAQKTIPQATFTQADLLTYMHPTLVDVVVSHGLHHHIHSKYLQMVAQYIKPGGVYVLGDEFLPHYNTNSERKLRAIIWYSHVIAEALSASHNTLALEEAKTLLDDLFHESSKYKTSSLVELVLRKAAQINDLTRQNQWTAANTVAERLLRDVEKSEGEAPMDLRLSRGDYKICHVEFVQQLKSTGLEVADLQTVGPTNTIGGFKTYVLKKT